MIYMFVFVGAMKRFTTKTNWKKTLSFWEILTLGKSFSKMDTNQFSQKIEELYEKGMITEQQRKHFKEKIKTLKIKNNKESDEDIVIRSPQSLKEIDTLHKKGKISTEEYLQLQEKLMKEKYEL